MYKRQGIRKRKLSKNGSGSHEYTAGISTVASKAVSSSSSAPTISYLQGHQILGAEVNGVWQYWLGDALGSTREVVDDTGLVLRSMEFAEHGQLLNSSGTGTFAPKTYQGALSVNDDTADSGLYLMGHRHFESGRLGRFISRDPIGFSGGLNLFSGAGVSPVSMVDPEGLEICSPSTYRKGAEAGARVTGALTRGAGGAAATRLTPSRAFPNPIIWIWLLLETPVGDGTLTGSDNNPKNIPMRPGPDQPQDPFPKTTPSPSPTPQTEGGGGDCPPPRDCKAEYVKAILSLQSSTYYTPAVKGELGIGLRELLALCLKNPATFDPGKNPFWPKGA